MKRETLRTVDQVVDALGGNNVVAEWLNIFPSAVCNWRDRQYIPAGWHLRIWLEAQSMGYRIDPKLFGLHDAPPLSLFRSRLSARSRHVA